MCSFHPSEDLDFENIGTDRDVCGAMPPPKHYKIFGPKLFEASDSAPVLF